MKVEMNELVIDKNIKLLNDIYIKEEKEIVARINSNFSDVFSYYKTDNTDKLNEKEILLKEKFKIINLIHENNNKVLRHALKNYVSAKENAEKLFKGVEK